MCGIAGFLTAKPADAGDRILRKMAGVIQHRGPDDAGFYSDPTAYLAHRRLSIIDLSQAGHQPMFNEDRRLCIIFNGEIFNHGEIRPELERAGHSYVSRSDTETILHAYEQWGPDCVERLRGMFAFAIWDKDSKTLFCARDRLGKKPFYYYWDGQLFAFGSEIKALFEHPSIKAQLEESLLPEYLAFGYCSGDRTLFRGIRKLPPGNWLRLETVGGNWKLQVQQYWDVPVPVPGEERTDSAWIQDCRQRLEETVGMRLMSDVPLGVFLSGGLDSSVITALVKRMTGGSVQTFSVGYEEEAYSELGYARQVAESIGTEHHETVVKMDDFFGALPNLIWHEDEPISWPSSVSLYFVSKLASKNVKVVLTGEGSDELFAGYSRYSFYGRNQRIMRWYGMVPGALRASLRSFIAQSSLVPRDLRRKLQHTVLGTQEDLQSIYLDSFYCAFPDAERKRLINSTASPYESFLQYWNARSGTGILNQMLYADQKTYLIELLMKQDQMSMATSIESRVPFLDHKFVEFAVRVPERMKLRGTTGKFILKEAVADLLPASIIHRKKMGFPTPLRDWLRTAKAKPILSMLQKPDGMAASYLNMDEVNGVIQRHTSGLEDGTDRIWRLLNLQIWGNLFLSGKPDPEEAAAGISASLSSK